MKLITAAIIFTLIVCVATGFVVYKHYQSQEVIDFGGVEINSKQLNDLTEPLGEGEFVICSMEDDKCALSYKKNIK